MPIIEVDHVTKEFRLGQLQSLRQTALNGLRRVTGRPIEGRKVFKALDDVSFTVEQGEVLGIIGHNGAGKSTLLKLLANISKPTRGRITVRGRVAPLIEVGAGLVPDLTGRENIYLNGAILGMPRTEITRKFDEIVAFAELEEFIDTPIKRYSSGMQVRIGFAIATAVESEVLIVDEVLAVGDLAFQRKCFDRIESVIRADGRTVLVVSHNLRQIERLTKRVVMLDHGQVAADGPAHDVCNLFFEASDRKIAEYAASGAAPASRHQGDGSIELLGLTLFDHTGRKSDQVTVGKPALVRLQYRVAREVKAPIFGVGVHTTDFIYLATEQSVGRLPIDSLPPGEHEISFRIRSVPLLPGIYSFRLGVAAGTSGAAIFYADGVAPFQVVAPEANRAWHTAPGEGFIALDAEWSMDTLSTRAEATHVTLGRIAP